jgi:predicted acetyltransferase
VEKLLGLPEITLYLGLLPQGVAGTALLCTHHGVAGFHMAGTRPEHRRRGVARQMMHHLIAEARSRGLEMATLQASAMGEPLYSQLGFRKQFTLHNYVSEKRTSSSG